MSYLNRIGSTTGVTLIGISTGVFTAYGISKTFSQEWRYTPLLLVAGILPATKYFCKDKKTKFLAEMLMENYVYWVSLLGTGLITARLLSST